MPIINEQEFWVILLSLKKWFKNSSHYNMIFLKPAFLNSGQTTWLSIKIVSPNLTGAIVINDVAVGWRHERNRRRVIMRRQSTIVSATATFGGGVSPFFFDGHETTVSSCVKPHLRVRLADRVGDIARYNIHGTYMRKDGKFD